MHNMHIRSPRRNSCTFCYFKFPLISDVELEIELKLIIGIKIITVRNVGKHAIQSDLFKKEYNELEVRGALRALTSSWWPFGLA